MGRFFVTAWVVLFFVSAAHGALQNQWTFNEGLVGGVIPDSGAEGRGATVVNLSALPTDPLFVGGRFDMTSNNGVGSAAANPDAATPNGIYVDLGNDLMNTALGGGNLGEASLEMWVTVETNRTWARLYDFGDSSAEDFSIGDGNLQGDYTFLTPQGAPGQPPPACNNCLYLSTHAPLETADSPETYVHVPIGDPAGALPAGVEQHIIVTYDYNDLSAGCPVNHTPCNDMTVQPNGTVRIYHEEEGTMVELANGPINPDLGSGFFNFEVNDWLGRSQWPDPLFDGQYDEFRVYDTALTSGEVNATAPKVAAPTPTLTVNREDGAVEIQNQSGSSQQLVAYSITSAASGLNVSASWDPIAPDAGWSIDSQTETEVAEHGGTAQTINADGSINIGTAWTPSIFEDLSFEYTLMGGTPGFGEVQYTGNNDASYGRSDLDTDGDVDTDDWAIFIANNATDLSGLTGTVARYLKGDLNDDGFNNYFDFLMFRSDYINAQGAGAFATLLAGVPEPSSLALVALALLGLFGARNRAARRNAGFFFRCVVPVLAVVAVVIGAQREADADLLHRYSFDSDISDSIGGAAFDGTVVDAGTTPNFTFANGELDLSANAGNGSNAITEDAYVDLPNGIVTSAASSGTDGAVTFEFYATVTTQRTWQRFGDFGTSDGGEDMSPTGAGSNYVLITPNSGRYNNGVEITNHPSSNVAEPNVGMDGPTPVGVQQHVVAVYDHTDTTGGPNGTETLYVNGGLVGTNELHADFDIRTMDDNNNWLGRSQWNDPIFTGRYNEFRIYDTVISPEQVAFNAAVGPNLISEPTPVLVLEADPNSGNVRLFNNLESDITFNYYEITSAMGALDPDGWNSLADQDGGGPGVGWDESGGSNENQLIELYLGGGTNGFTLAGGASKFLGAAFDTSVFGEGNDGDLVLAFGLNSASSLLDSVGGVVADVRYVEVLPPEGVLGDYNGDGVVNAADYVAFRNALASGGTLMNEFASPGVTDQADYDYWVTRFGATSGSGSGGAATIPEPATLVVMLAGVALLLAGRGHPQR